MTEFLKYKKEQIKEFCADKSSKAIADVLIVLAEQLVEDLRKWRDKGNKRAAVRARKATVLIGNHFGKYFRIKSVDE